MLFSIILLIISLLFITLLSNFLFILTKTQVYELWVSSFLLLLILGFIRDYFLGSQNEHIFLLIALYIPWFFFTKMSVNLINRDDNVIRDSPFGGTLEISIATIIFLFLFGFIRPMLLGDIINTKDAIITSTLFFIWYYLSKNLYM